MHYFIKIFNRSYIQKSFIFSQKRNFLSTNFGCKDIWENRLNAPLFQKVSIESMYYILENQYNKTKKLNAIDVDIFLNVQTNDSFITEVEELVHKLRLTAETGNTLPTTHHAFIRLFLEYNKKNELIRILNDRLNYGIFPDNYCNIYMLDTLLKENDFRAAAKVATIQMLQEDFSNPLVKYLSLYAIHRYLLSKEPWEDIDPEKKEQDDDEEEEIKVRVPFLRNPYHDEHFDLTDGHHLCGKSLVMISSLLPSLINKSYRIMGLSLLNQWDKLEYELIQLAERNVPSSLVYAESIVFTKANTEEKLKDNNKLNKILGVLEQIELQTHIQGSLLEQVKNTLIEEIEKHEINEIQIQEKLYKDWQTLRDNKLKEYLDEMNTRKRLEEVKRKKDELKQKEELLYFFDNEDHIDMVIERKTELIKKRPLFDLKTQQEENYIPPEIQKRSSRD